MPTMRLSGKIMLHCFARCYMVGAAFNTRGMQNVGLAFALEPGLRKLYTDPDALVAARKRYIKHYNTHPFWTPMLAGIFLSLETGIAKGVVPEDAFESIKSTAVYTLSAIGDSFFGGSLLALWSLVTVCLISAGYPLTAMVLGAVLLTALQCFKAVTFWVGFRRQFEVLKAIRNLNLIDWGKRIKYANCMLLILFWVLLWPAPLQWQEWLWGMLSLGLAAAIVIRLQVPREFVAWLILLSLVAWPFASRLMMSLVPV
jgi:PTS system mannose-specific IID component